MHRVGQFVAYVRARVDPAEQALVERLLPPPAAALFAAMPVADRRHGLDVAEKLLASGIDDGDVLAAALLHDAAKGEGMGLVHRVGGVLLQAVGPGLLHRLARDESGSWRYGFHLFLHHEALSAQMATDAGCPPRVAAFIRGEANPGDVRLAAALKAADDAS